jgi:hypothetical protein
MHFGETWFPSKGDSKIVGRVGETRAVDRAASEKAGKTVWKSVPCLLSKVPGSIDESSQVIKPHNQKELTDRFPGCWDWYLKMKEQSVDAKAPPSPFLPEGASTAGTPLHEADFIPRDKIAWLSSLGFSTVEQIASMDDVTVQNIRGASKWRKQAQEFLKRT